MNDSENEPDLHEAVIQPIKNRQGPSLGSKFSLQLTDTEVSKETASHLSSSSTNSQNVIFRFDLHYTVHCIFNWL